MDRLTDEELERLLRETFADKEKLVDTLLWATRRRRSPVPALLAAAAVLVVLGGILYGVNRDPDVDPVAVPPTTAVQPQDEDAQIWASAVTAITQKFQPKYELQLVVMPQRTSPEADLVIVPSREYNSGPQNESATTAQPFSSTQMDQIADQVGAATQVQVEWLQPGVYAGPVDTCAAPEAAVLVGNVVDKGDHKEVRTKINYGCDFVYAVTYRVEKRADTWTATGPVGSGEGTWPVGSTCAPTGKKPATPPKDC
ncbi:hypothetical protein [Kribbella sp. NPDC055071]